MEINFKAPYEIIPPLGEYLTQRYGLRYISRDGLSEPAKWHGKNIYSAVMRGELSFSPPIPFIGFGFYVSDSETRATDAICGFNIFPEGVPGATYIDRRGPDASFSVDGGVRIPVIPGREYPFGLGQPVVPQSARMEPRTIENLEGRLHFEDELIRKDAAEAIAEAGSRGIRITQSMRDIFKRRALIPFNARDPLHKDARKLMEEAVAVGIRKDGDNAALRRRDVEVALMLHPKSTECLLEAWGVGKLFTASELQDMQHIARNYRRSRYQSFD